MNTQTPYEQIRFINDVIKDRKDKNQATFFSVKLERSGNVTPLVEKETGDTFYETLIQYLTRYDISHIIIDLYHGKAHNIKEPFQTFKIAVKRSSDASLGVIAKDDILITPTENVITTEKHFMGIIEKERQILFLDFELKKLQSEIEELKKKNKKRKQYILELEAELENKEKTKKQSLGNVSLGMVASNAIENFAKSNFGIGILKNVFGANQDMLNGLLGIDENPNDTSSEKETEQKSTASIITKTKQETSPQSEQEKLRTYVIKQLTEFLNGLDDGALRLYFEITQLIGKDQNKLQHVYMALKQSSKQTATTPAETKSTVSTKETEEATNSEPDLKDSS